MQEKVAGFLMKIFLLAILLNQTLSNGLQKTLTGLTLQWALLSVLRACSASKNLLTYRVFLY